MIIKLMSYNIQHCRNYLTRDDAHLDFEGVARVLRMLDADIIGLNEVRGKGASPAFQDQVGEIAKRTSYPYRYFMPAVLFNGVNPYGNAMLARYPAERVEKMAIPDPAEKTEKVYYETRCLLKAQFAVPIRLTVYVAHFGLAKSEQHNAVDVFIKETNRLAGPFVLMGDFNVQPEDEVLRPIRERMSDAAVRCQGELLSFPSDIPKCKIDYIFVSRDVKVLTAAIPAVVQSDHRPHVATIEISDGKSR